MNVGGAVVHAAFAGTKLVSLSAGGALSAALNFTGRVCAIKARGAAEGAWTAASFDSVLVKRGSFSATLEATASVGSLTVIGGNGPAADTFGPGKIASFLIGGDVVKSVIGAGFGTTDRLLKNADDFIATGGASKIGKLKITGAASADSYFRAGKFASAVRIGGVKIDTATEANRIASLRAGLDGAAAATFADVFNGVAANGSLDISTALLDTLAGGQLADGAHTLHLLAADQTATSRR